MDIALAWSKGSAKLACSLLNASNSRDLRMQHEADEPPTLGDYRNLTWGLESHTIVSWANLRRMRAIHVQRMHGPTGLSRLVADLIASRRDNGTFDAIFKLIGEELLTLLQLSASSVPDDGVRVFELLEELSPQRTTRASRFLERWLRGKEPGTDKARVEILTVKTTFESAADDMDTGCLYVIPSSYY
ncbi:unnamed protein product [Peniophora sp. CBMAI 1063]|nr:unnamed protein product [Peniophora sp. CBMAI 1063]